MVESADRHRRIRSFVTRAGRISPAQQRAIDDLLPLYEIPYAPGPLDFSGRPTVLEIGFGMGIATAEIAAVRPDVDFVGIEVHTPGIGALLRQIEERGLKNLRVVAHDAVEILEHMIAPDSLAGVHIFFPDPWPKARHHKRRLVQPSFVSTVASRLSPKGYIHCATDWQNYAEQMLEVLSAEPRLRNTAEAFSSPVNPLVTRPQTKFEHRGRKLGHGVWDLVFVKR